MQNKPSPPPELTPRLPCVTKVKQDQAPVFLTGFARSGTTWVNHLFREYLDAGFVNEGQFIINYGLRLDHFGDLHRQENFDNLVGHMSRDAFFSILKRNYSVSIDWEQVRRQEPRFQDIVREILRQVASGLGKKTIGSKYPVFGRHMGLLVRLFPDCRVVHVIRDGRDCALSHRTLTWGHQNTYAAAVNWNKYLATMRKDSGILGDRYLEIRYEDLLTKPEQSMQRLAQFVTGNDGVDVARRFLADRNAGKQGSIARWRRDMPPGSQAIFETVAGEMLAAYGYPLTGSRRAIPGLFKWACLAHDRAVREAWHYLRKLNKNIGDRKPW